MYNYVFKDFHQIMFALSKKFILLVVLFVLAGCATRVPVPESDKAEQWEQHLAKLSKVEDWFFKGRIAIQLQKEGFSASLHWRQSQQDYLLRLIAPLGRGTFELKGNGQEVSLKTAEDRVIQADTPELLMQQNLGWYVPVSGLRYWLRGLPQPEVTVETLLLDEHGRMDQLRQAGWHVIYRNYLQQDGYELPSKLTLENDNLKVRFSIKQWNTSP